MLYSNPKLIYDPGNMAHREAHKQSWIEESKQASSAKYSKLGI